MAQRDLEYEYRRKNRDRMLEYHRQYYAEHKEQYREYVRKYRSQPFRLNVQARKLRTMQRNIERGNQLRAWRKEHGYTQERVAELFDYTQTFIGRMERGEAHTPDWIIDYITEGVSNV